MLKASKSKASKNIKDTGSTHKASVAHDIKNSYIQNLHMRSGMFYLWLVSGILGYAQKIPFISKIITLVSFYYGRTTIWKVLVKIRKVFVFINAVIGVYMVYKSVGFSYDNILAGFIGMGENYLIILTNFTKRMFNWFFELFDYKIIPNIPNNKPSSSWPDKISLPKSDVPPYYKNEAWIDEMFKTKAKGDWFKPSPQYNINFNTNPWYMDLTTWLWVAGVAGTLGACYVGYQFFCNPLFIQDGNFFSFLQYFKSSNPNINQVSPDGTVTDNLGERFTELKDDSGSKSYVALLSNQLKKLNPFYWITSAAEHNEQYSRFMEKQNALHTQDFRFFPFTTDNPFASWQDRMRIHWFGETLAEKTSRIELRSLAWTEMTRLSVKSVISAPQSPGVAAVGLGLMNLPSGSIDFVESSNSYLRTLDSLVSAPTSPQAHFDSLPSTGNPFENMFENEVKALHNINIDLDDVVESVSTPLETSN
jgi:hypothetical protein